MNSKSKALLDLMHDELAILDTWGTPRAHETLGSCRGNRMKFYLKRLHAVFSDVGIKPTDDQRHYIFSRLFDRKIGSAKEVTIIETVVWANIARTHKTSASLLLTDLINESDGH
jgi:hypothetical protein